MITKIDDIKDLLTQARTEPLAVVRELRKLAASTIWQTREVAATALVHIGKRHPEVILQVARTWAKDKDANIRRAASEGMRGIVKIDPDGCRSILETLKGDSDLYVKKSVANVLRNATGKHPAFVSSLCCEWAKEKNIHTRWIVKDGMKKLKVSVPHEAARITQQLERSS